MDIFAKLDDEVFRTRAVDNQVKTISARKADKEGYMAVVLADSFFGLFWGFDLEGEVIESRTFSTSLVRGPN